MLLKKDDPRLAVYLRCCDEVAELHRELFAANAARDMRQYRTVATEIEAVKRRGHADLARQFGFEHVGPGSLCDLGRRRVVSRGCDNHGLVDHGEALRRDGVISAVITHAYQSPRWLRRAAHDAGVLAAILPRSLHNACRGCTAAILSSGEIE